ncbi:uncharacterized protein [Narcine bancroftii]|uniref:uncharacterized protein isoform X2 n=1 Tax=Narcine bancroftii TaxID=1343680 RepID=UPI003831CFF2
MVQPVVQYNTGRTFQMFRLMLLILLLEGHGISAAPHEIAAYIGSRQARDHSPGTSYESPPSQSMAEPVTVHRHYFEDPVIFDESSQFETIVFHKSQREVRDVVLEMSSPVQLDLIEDGGRDQDEDRQTNTCCVLESGLLPQSNRHTKSNSRIHALTTVSSVSEVMEGSGLHHLLPDPRDTNRESQIKIRKEFEGTTQTSSHRIRPPSSDNKEHMITLQTSNPHSDHSFVPTKSNKVLQRVLPSKDGASTNSRKVIESNINSEETSNLPIVSSTPQEHWPIQLILITESNANQSSKHSWNACTPGYILVNDSCWSVCEVIPDYCYNGGACGIIEDVGAICRCSAKDHSWYRGHRCQTVLTEVQLICILLGASLLVALLFFTLILIFAIKLRSLKKIQQRFDSRSKLWISSAPQGNSSYSSEIRQQGYHSPLARCSPDTQCVPVSENHLTQNPSSVTSRVRW